MPLSHKDAKGRLNEVSNVRQNAFHIHGCQQTSKRRRKEVQMSNRNVPRTYSSLLHCEKLTFSYRSKTSQYCFATNNVATTTRFKYKPSLYVIISKIN